MKVSIIIPFHDEEKLVEKTLKKTCRVLDRNQYDYDIVAVDDNSNDNTGWLIDNLARRNRRIKAFHKKNQYRGPSGLGNALRFGFRHATGDIMITFMGDLSDNPDDIPKLIKKSNQGYDIVCGSRFIGNGQIKNYPRVKMICNRLWNNFFAFLFATNLKDISNGFRLYKREVIDTVKPSAKGFEITSEIVLKGYIKGFRIVEVPVSWYGRESGKSKFGSFSFLFIFTKLPVIGWDYGKLALRLWFIFLFQKLKRLFIL